ncbi:hypothetical protein CKA55_03890 [Arcobacter suis]|uniref:DUF1311 domain-containing protein n=1 Tax=Arcobacter suis CECT 7833 TaxID=663365 RepID=A0AAD0SQV9_9BACT|nr:lysozyme inhibitor LprI family protein [Arcobacter suis]AXX90006.1 DUF1311 domain-containing protein [Arcobacter suis CECT 7833]RWS47139.1 hypothetical protein CKA55_03890 [Arcobacter suis]
MKKIVFTLGMLISLNLFAFENKDIDTFLKLESFETVEKFESYINKYTQECLDNGFGGTGSIPCFVSYELWDKELNIYYRKLMSKLTAKEKELLKESQKKWLESRDKTIEFNSLMLDKNYDQEGTMFLLDRANVADSDISEIIKNRALYLKNWYDKLNNR